MNRLLLIALSIVLFSSCKKEEDDAKMPDEVRPYFEEFCSQAKSRGFKIKFRHLKEIVLQGTISQSQDDVGYGCSAGGYYDHQTKKIYLDTTGVDWVYNREALISHELGHALARREHRSDLFIDNKTPKSIMHWSDMAPLNTMTKSYYFDEMFNQNTSDPYWVQGWK